MCELMICSNAAQFACIINQLSSYQGGATPVYSRRSGLRRFFLRKNARDRFVQAWFLRQLVFSRFERNLSPEFSGIFPDVTGIHVLTAEPRRRSWRTLAAIFGPLSQLRDLVLRFFDARIHLPDGFFVSAWRRDSWDWRASANFTGRTARTAPGKQRTAILAAGSTGNPPITPKYQWRAESIAATA